MTCDCQPIIHLSIYRTFKITRTHLIMYLFFQNKILNSKDSREILVPRNSLLSALSWRHFSANYPAPCLVFLVPVKNVICSAGRLFLVANVRKIPNIAFFFNRNPQLAVTQNSLSQKGLGGPLGCPLSPLVLVPNKVHIVAHIAKAVVAILLNKGRYLQQASIRKNFVQDVIILDDFHLQVALEAQLQSESSGFRHNVWNTNNRSGR